MTAPAEDARAEAGSLRLSVIVPLGPGETAHHALLETLRGLPASAEVILVEVEGASTEAVASRTGGFALRVIGAPAGRARQMNRGAAAAHGTWLWFLHADTLASDAAIEAALAFTERDAPSLGWFDLRFRRDGPWPTALNAWGANLRSAWFGLPFGDQGLLLPASWFERLGGYDEAARYGEDHLFVWSAHAAGLPVLRVGASLSTSARKYARRGWASTTLLHWRLTAVQAWQGWRGVRRARAARSR